MTTTDRRPEGRGPARAQRPGPRIPGRTRVVAAVASVALIVLLAVLTWPERVPIEPARVGSSLAPPSGPRPLGSARGEPPAAGAVDPAPTPAQRQFVDRVDSVRESCDLDLDLRCDDAACAGVLTAPDLDRLGGWLTFVLDSPRFVLSTAARDLGVPPRVLPCGSAVGQLVGDGGVTAVELPDGTEVWCTISGSEEAGKRLCDALAAHRGYPDARFDQPGLRQLTFARTESGR